MKNLVLCFVAFLATVGTVFAADSDSWSYRADSSAYDSPDLDGIYLRVQYIPEGSANYAQSITSMEFVKGLPSGLTARNYGGFQPAGVTGISYLVADSSSIAFKINQTTASSQFYNLIVSSAEGYGLGSVQDRQAKIDALTSGNGSNLLSVDSIVSLKKNSLLLVLISFVSLGINIAVGIFIVRVCFRTLRRFLT